MRVLVRFWTVLALCFCFQGGIASSAASAIKWQHAFERLTSPQPTETGVAAPAETPWPSCKSMTALAEMAGVVPPLRAEAVGVFGPDHRRGLWRTLSIDEPPKALPIAS